MHLILTGATGFLGSACLHYMLNAPNITRVSILSRKPVPMAAEHPKASVIIHTDYTSYPPELLAKLEGAEGCVWAQGTSQTGVDKEEYVKITVDYPVSAAKAFTALSSPTTPFKFVYVSGEGATTSPGFFTPLYGSTKGKAEASLLALMPSYPPLRPYSLRPAVVDSKGHPEIHAIEASRQQPIGKKIFEPILKPAFRVAWKSFTSPTRELGKVLTELAAGDGEPLSGEGISGAGRTISNVAFRRMAGLNGGKKEDL